MKTVMLLFECADHSKDVTLNYGPNTKYRLKKRSDSVGNKSYWG